eukprot:m.88680 g.88680  ORF g.88680 m.88680 type:complete len:98 (+) comp26223_c0_seq2:809-1102(+)
MQRCVVEAATAIAATPTDILPGRTPFQSSASVLGISSSPFLTTARFEILCATIRDMVAVVAPTPSHTQDMSKIPIGSICQWVVSPADSRTSLLFLVR